MNSIYGEESMAKRTYAVIYETVCKIPYGRVATYGQIADLSHLPGRARLVGYALYRIVEENDIPWHRVINAQGRVSESPVRYGSDDLQRVLLEAEGIPFRPNGSIDLKAYRWQPNITEFLSP
jgi:methylated-DNA-protein-cysteine methyltransferase-like protein